MSYSPKTNWVNNDIVKPSDMNRIEGGISDLDKNKSDKDLSNVTDATFLAKAKKSNVATYSPTMIKFYVASSANDATANGSSSAPFRTIQQAIDAFPDCNDKSVDYIIDVADGGYPEVTLNSSKNIKIYVSGAVTITGNLNIKSGKLAIASLVEGSSFSLFEGTLTMLGGCFNCSVPFGVVQSSPGVGIAINCSNQSQFGVQNEVIIMNFDGGIDCACSAVNIRKLTTTAAKTGVICQSGIVIIGAEAIDAPTKFLTQHGGRIYLGAQTNLPNY